VGVKENWHSYNAHISRCIVSGNGRTSSSFRAGISNNSGLIENSIVAGTKSCPGLNRCSNILNCTVAYNAVGFKGCSGSIKHCIIWNNDVNLSNSSTPELSGTVNPLFIRPGVWHEVQNRWIEGDYHLLPDSPYIDAGDPFYGDPEDPTVDADGNPRVIGTRIDIGAYEFNQNCEGLDFDGDEIPDLCDKDIDNDGVSNSFDPCDFTPLTTSIDETGRPRADLNKDCAVNLADFAIMQKDFVTFDKS
jgi:hypothetical protein